MNLTHGKTKTAEYRIWKLMKARCFWKGWRGFHRYGGRGITVCKRWMDFALFFADMGSRPSSKHSIDRINNDGNYEPGNCHWVTMKEQAANRAKANRIYKPFATRESALKGWITKRSK